MKKFLILGLIPLLLMVPGTAFGYSHVEFTVSCSNDKIIINTNSPITISFQNESGEIIQKTPIDQERTFTRFSTNIGEDYLVGKEGYQDRHIPSCYSSENIKLATTHTKSYSLSKNPATVIGYECTKKLDFSKSESPYEYPITETLYSPNIKITLNGVGLIKAVYSNGIVQSETNSVAYFPVYLDEATKIEKIVAESKYGKTEKEVKSCNTELIEKEYIDYWVNEQEKIQTIQSQANAPSANELVYRQVSSLCSYFEDSCFVTYGVDYRINAPNEYFQEIWTKDNEIMIMDKVVVDFGSARTNDYYYRSSTHYNDGEVVTNSGYGAYDVRSWFIMKNGYYSGNDIVDWKSEKKVINVAGHSRNAVHFWNEYELDTVAGIATLREDHYHDLESGLLLKSDFNRSVLDVSGKTNSDGYTFELKSVNFPKPSSGMGGGCLIATATFDSELAPQVQKLREIRDSKLLQTESGSAFMEHFNQFYYSFSPIIADYERENPIFKEMVKMGVTPLLTTLSLMDYAESESEVLGIGIGVILLNLGMYVGVPVFAILRIRK